MCFRRDFNNIFFAILITKSKNKRSKWGSFAAFFTAYYSTRLLALTFLRPANGLRSTYEHAHESPFAMAFPLVVLSFASLFVGFTSRDMMIGLGTDFWGNALFTLPNNQHFVEAEWLDTSVKMIPLFFFFWRSLSCSIPIYK